PRRGPFSSATHLMRPHVALMSPSCRPHASMLHCWASLPDQLQDEKEMAMSNEAHRQTLAPGDADREKIARIRADVPVTQWYRYCNTGTNGPLPQRAHDALVASAQEELSQGRIRQAGFTSLLQNLSDARTAVAQLLSCDAAQIALTRNTTEGMNIALMG